MLHFVELTWDVSVGRFAFKGKIRNLFLEKHSCKEKDRFLHRALPCCCESVRLLEAVRNVADLFVFDLPVCLFCSVPVSSHRRKNCTSGLYTFGHLRLPEKMDESVKVWNSANASNLFLRIMDGCIAHGLKTRPDRIP